MKTFVKWAAATRTDLQSYPALNDKMRVLEQCITPEAKTALWACTTLTTNGVPVDYPSDAVKNAANAANLKARSDFHIEWLTEIIAACSPNTSAHIVKEMEKVKFGEGASGGIILEGVIKRTTSSGTWARCLIYRNNEEIPCVPG